MFASYRSGARRRHLFPTVMFLGTAYLVWRAMCHYAESGQAGERAHERWSAARDAERQRLDKIDKASADSFPASDPPGY